MLKTSFALGIAILTVFVSASPLFASCRGKSPIAMFECLSASYSGRDIQAYTALLADDFVYEFGESQWSREAELASAGKMFLAADDLELTFSGLGEPEAVEAGWRVRIEETTLRLSVPERSEPYVVTNKSAIVEISWSEDAGYKVRRWVQPVPQSDER